MISLGIGSVINELKGEVRRLEAETKAPAKIYRALEGGIPEGT
jgi:hypothetical protein